jgi:hypothetical protein
MLQDPYQNLMPLVKGILVLFLTVSERHPLWEGLVSLNACQS